MNTRIAKAEVPLLRQRTQYSCMSASMCACLNALGYKCSEDEVNEVMGARPMKGAAWEQALACAQHYGVRGMLVCPSTVNQLREWTDAGKPVMIAWNPEGRDWSHASVVFDVTDTIPAELPSECSLLGSRDSSGPWVWVADTNIPNPEKTVRVVCADTFYSKWFEKWPNYLVRRPALMLDREVTPEGRQVMASRARYGYDTSRERDSAREERQMMRELRKQEDYQYANVLEGFFLMAKALVEGYAVMESDPDLSWFATKLNKRVKAVMPKFVLGELLKESEVSESHKLFLSGKLEDLQKDYLEAWSKFYKYDTLKAVWALFPAWLRPYASAQKKFRPVQKVAPQKTVVDSTLSDKFAVLDKLISEGFPQAQIAAKAVKDAYESGGKPSEEQLKALRNMLYRSKMREEADQFRIASMKASRNKTAEPYDCLKDGLRGRELAECYMGFPEDLGPEDIAFVQRYFPDWSPYRGGYSQRYPSRAPVPKQALPADYPNRAKKLYAVLYAINDSVPRKFVRDNLYKTELSEKQIKWFESLEKKHSAILRKMPDTIYLQFVNNSPVIGISSPSEKEKWERVLNLTPFKGHEYYISGLAQNKPEPVVQAPAPAVAPSTGDRVLFDSDKTQKMLPILERLSKFSGMFAGFKRDLETGKGLTENQLKAIRHQLYKSGMRAEADNFRVASVESVVSRHLAKLAGRHV